MMQADCDGGAGQSECVTTVVKTDWTEAGAVVGRNQVGRSDQESVKNDIIE